MFNTDYSRLNPPLSFTEDLTAKYYQLHHSTRPLQLITDAAHQCWEGSRHLNLEQVVLPLGFGTLSGISAIQCAKEALKNFSSCNFTAGLNNTAWFAFSAFISIYNFNQLANITYEAGGNYWNQSSFSYNYKG